MKNLKLRNLLILIFNLCIVGGIYIFANKMRFLPIMWIYSLVACVSICVYIYLYMKNNIENAKPMREGRTILSEEEREKAAKRRKNMQVLVLIFLPFTIVLLCDYTYLLLLADSQFFKSLTSLFNV